MPVPKRRTSKARRSKRRSHDALGKPNVIACPDCGEPTLAHRVCPHCGKYRGREHVSTEEE